MKRSFLQTQRTCCSLVFDFAGLFGLNGEVTAETLGAGGILVFNEEDAIDMAPPPTPAVAEFDCACTCGCSVPLSVTDAGNFMPVAAESMAPAGNVSAGSCRCTCATCTPGLRNAKFGLAAAANDAEAAPIGGDMNGDAEASPPTCDACWWFVASKSAVGIVIGRR